MNSFIVWTYWAVVHKHWTRNNLIYCSYATANVYWILWTKHHVIQVLLELKIVELFARVWGTDNCWWCEYKELHLMNNLIIIILNLRKPLMQLLNILICWTLIMIELTLWLLGNIIICNIQCCQSIFYNINNYCIFVIKISNSKLSTYYMEFCM